MTVFAVTSKPDDAVWATDAEARKRHLLVGGERGLCGAKDMVEDSISSHTFVMSLHKCGKCLHINRHPKETP